MKRFLVVAGLMGALALARPASAHSSFWLSIGLPGVFGFFAPAPCPTPVAYAPPAYYYPPAYYAVPAPPPVFLYRHHGHGHHHGWWKHDDDD